MKTLRMDISDLRCRIRAELEQRRLSNAPGHYAHTRDGNAVPLYGLTGAANLYAQLGFPLGDFHQRQQWCDRINAMQRPDGSFESTSGSEHAASMAIIALNLLGGEPAAPVRNLAPLDASRLDNWLNQLDWDDTHKDFCSAVAPVLASGLVDRQWVQTLQRNVNQRLDPDRPLNVWCGEHDEPMRVISCIYHVVNGYDAAFLPYPHPDMIWDRLIGVEYDQCRDDVQRTICTDFDYAWVLSRLVHQLPERFEEFLHRCRGVLEKCIVEWHERGASILATETTHNLYTYVIGWATYQRILPYYFEGPGLNDTLNVPWVWRLASAAHCGDAGTNLKSLEKTIEA